MDRIHRSVSDLSEVLSISEYFFRIGTSAQSLGVLYTRPPVWRDSAKAAAKCLWIDAGDIENRSYPSCLPKKFLKNIIPVRVVFGNQSRQIYVDHFT